MLGLMAGVTKLSERKSALTLCELRLFTILSGLPCTILSPDYDLGLNSTVVWVQSLADIDVTHNGSHKYK